MLMKEMLLDAHEEDAQDGFSLRVSQDGSLKDGSSESIFSILQ